MFENFRVASQLRTNSNSSVQHMVFGGGFLFLEAKTVIIAIVLLCNAGNPFGRMVTVEPRCSLLWTFAKIEAAAACRFQVGLA